MKRYQEISSRIATLGGAFLYNPRTTGTLPDLFDEADIGVVLFSALKKSGVGDAACVLRDLQPA